MLKSSIGFNRQATEVSPPYAPIDLCSFFCLDNVPHVVM